MDSYGLTHSLSVFFLLGVSGGWQVLRRTPFASLTPAPPTIYFVPLRGTVFWGDVEVFMCVCPQKCLVLWMREVPRRSCP
jgi:hypothetical protein